MKLFAQFTGLGPKETRRLRYRTLPWGHIYPETSVQSVTPQGSKSPPLQGCAHVDGTLSEWILRQDAGGIGPGQQETGPGKCPQGAGGLFPGPPGNIGLPSLQLIFLQNIGSSKSDYLRSTDLQLFSPKFHKSGESSHQLHSA